MAAGIAGLALLLALLPNPYERIRQIDANSARERTLHRVFGLSFVTPHPSDIAEFAGKHLQPVGPPAWRSFHYASPFNSVRKSYLYGRLRHGFKQLETTFEWSDLFPAPAPLETRVSAVRAALAELSAGRELRIELIGEGGFELWAEDGALLVEYEPVSPASPSR